MRAFFIVVALFAVSTGTVQAEVYGGTHSSSSYPMPVPVGVRPPAAPAVNGCTSAYLPGSKSGQPYYKDSQGKVYFQPSLELTEVSLLQERDFMSRPAQAFGLVTFALKMTAEDSRQLKELQSQFGAQNVVNLYPSKSQVTYRQPAPDRTQDWEQTQKNPAQRFSFKVSNRSLALLYQLRHAYNASTVYPRVSYLNPCATTQSALPAPSNQISVGVWDRAHYGFSSPYHVNTVKTVEQAARKFYQAHDMQGKVQALRQVLMAYAQYPSSKDRQMMDLFKVNAQQAVDGILNGMTTAEILNPQFQMLTGGSQGSVLAQALPYFWLRNRSLAASGLNQSFLNQYYRIRNSTEQWASRVVSTSLLQEVPAWDGSREWQVYPIADQYQTLGARRPTPR